MKASFVDLRRKSAAIIRALQRKEPVTVLYRGVPAAIMQPVDQPTAKPIGSVKNHAAFGMWADRDDIKDVASHVRRIRRGRYDAL
jgi:antitoxin (DNA-binding transcriptional repressor) of toxin-antitoxin stability system